MQLESVGLMISKWLTLPISQKSKADFLTAHDLIRFNHILNLSFLGFEIKKKKTLFKNTTVIFRSNIASPPSRYFSYFELGFKRQHSRP